MKPVVGIAVVVLLVLLAVGGWYLGSGGNRAAAPPPTTAPDAAAPSAIEWISPQVPKAGPEGWITLFDGKRLYGCVPAAADVEAGKVRLEEGRLRLDSTGLRFDLSGRDMAIRVRLKKVSGQNCSLGVRCAGNGRDTGGWFNGGNWFGIGHHVGGPWKDVANVRAGKRYDDFFEMEYRAEGSRLTLKADGEVICAGDDDAMVEGTVGVNALKGVTLIERIEARVLDRP